MTEEDMRVSSGHIFTITMTSIALIVSLSGCSDRESPPQKDRSIASSSTPQSSVTASASASPSAGSDNDKWGISLSATIITDSYGTYHQIAAQPSSPLMQYDESLADASAKAAYSAEDIRAAQQTVSSFYVSEGIDSRLVFDDSAAAKDKWLAENDSRFSEKYQGDLFVSVQNATVASGYGVVEGNGGGWVETSGLRPYEYKDGNSRVAIQDIKIAKITTTSTGDLRFDYTATYDRPVYDAQDALHLNVVKVTQAYSVAKAADGTWKLTGWASHFTNDWSQGFAFNK